MTERLYLHIGTPKSGTSYLQSVLRDNQQAFRGLGLLFPFDKLRSYYALYECAVHGFDGPDSREWAVERYDRFAARVSAWDGDTIASHEALVRLSPEQAALLRDRLEQLDVDLQVVLTVRDLARQIPSSWQQEIKVGSTGSFADYLASIRTDRSTQFWREQDVGRILDTWTSVVGADRITVVTIPPPKSPPDLLWHRFAAAIEFDPARIRLTEEHRSNRSMGAVDAEIFRRLNEVAARREAGQDDYLEHHRKRRAALGRRISSNVGDREAPSYSDDLHAWVQEESSAVVAAVKGAGCRIVGDVADLEPGEHPPPGTDPDVITDEQIARRVPEILEDVFIDYESQLTALRVELAQTKAASRKMKERADEQVASSTSSRTNGRRIRARARRD